MYISLLNNQGDYIVCLLSGPRSIPSLARWVFHAHTHTHTHTHTHRHIRTKTYACIKVICKHRLIHLYQIRLWHPLSRSFSVSLRGQIKNTYCLFVSVSFSFSVLSSRTDTQRDRHPHTRAHTHTHTLKPPLSQTLSLTNTENRNHKSA